MNLETINLGLFYLVDVLGVLFLVALLLIGLGHGAWWLYKQVVGWKLISAAVQHYRKYLQGDKPADSNAEIDALQVRLIQLKKILWVILSERGGRVRIDERLLLKVPNADEIRINRNPGVEALEICIRPASRGLVTDSNPRIHPKEVDSERRLLEVPLR